jgi:hypothetical protein
MSDLARDIATQPTTIPVLSTEDGTYTAPGEAWDGEPVRAPLSDGEEEAGLVPGTGLGAEVINDLLGRLGHAIAAVADSAALTWDPRAITADFPGSYTAVPYGGNYVAKADGIRYSNRDGEVLLALSSTNTYLTLDGVAWEDMGVHGVSRARGPAVGNRDVAGVPYITTVVWQCQSGGAVKYSDILGGTWASAGTLPTFVDPGTSATSQGFGGAFNSRWFAMVRSRLFYQDGADLAGATTWGEINVAALGFSHTGTITTPTCFETSPTECAIGVTGSPCIIHSADGTTFAAATYSPTAADGVAAMHWSESHGLWIILSNTNNRIFTAPAGFGSFTERPQITDDNGNVVSGLYAVTSIGRTIIVAAGNGLWVSRGFGSWRRIPNVRLSADESGGSNTLKWHWLRTLNGRAWAGRAAVHSSASSTEYALSAVLPSEFARQGAF